VGGRDPAWGGEKLNRKKVKTLLEEKKLPRGSNKKGEVSKNHAVHWRYLQRNEKSREIANKGYELKSKETQGHTRKTK